MSIQNNTTDLQTVLETVNALPDYVDTTGTATAGDVLSGKTATVNGSKVTGTMANNGAISQTMDGVTTKSKTIPAGYTSGGTVSLDSTIDTAVASAITALTDKGVTVPSGTNVTGLAELISAIEAGGGAKVAYGSFSVAEPMANYTITHDLGVIPNIVVCVASSNGSNQNNTKRVMMYWNGWSYTYFYTTNSTARGNAQYDITAIDGSINTGNTASKEQGTSAFEATTTTVKVGSETHYSYYKIGTYSYSWIAIGEAS